MFIDIVILIWMARRYYKEIINETENLTPEEVEKEEEERGFGEGSTEQLLTLRRTSSDLSKVKDVALFLVGKTNNQ